MNFFYADYIYLDDDADEQELLIKATEAYTQLTNIFTRQKNLYYDPWIVFAVYHPTKGWGLTVFAPGSYTPEILYGRYTEATLPYPDM